MLIQSYISHPRGTVFYHLINFLSSKSCPIQSLRKISEIIETMIFTLSIFTKMLFFMQCWRLRAIKPKDFQTVLLTIFIRLLSWEVQILKCMWSSYGYITVSESNSFNSKWSDWSQFILFFAGGSAFLRKTLTKEQEMLSSFDIVAKIANRVQ